MEDRRRASDTNTCSHDGHVCATVNLVGPPSAPLAGTSRHGCDEGRELVTAVPRVPTPGRGRVGVEARAGRHVSTRTNRSELEAAAAVRAHVVEHALDAGRAKGALVRADPRVGRSGGKSLSQSSQFGRSSSTRSALAWTRKRREVVRGRSRPASAPASLNASAGLGAGCMSHGEPLEEALHSGGRERHEQADSKVTSMRPGSRRRSGSSAGGREERRRRSRSGAARKSSPSRNRRIHRARTASRPRARGRGTAGRGPAAISGSRAPSGRRRSRCHAP